MYIWYDATDVISNGGSTKKKERKTYSPQRIPGYQVYWYNLLLNSLSVEFVTYPVKNQATSKPVRSAKKIRKTFPQKQSQHNVRVLQQSEVSSAAVRVVVRVSALAESFPFEWEIGCRIRLLLIVNKLLRTRIRRSSFAITTTTTTIAVRLYLRVCCCCTCCRGKLLAVL